MGFTSSQQNSKGHREILLLKCENYYTMKHNNGFYLLTTKFQRTQRNTALKMRKLLYHET